MSEEKVTKQYLYNINNLVASMKKDQKRKSISDGLNFVLIFDATKNIISPCVCKKYTENLLVRAFIHNVY